MTKKRNLKKLNKIPKKIKQKLINECSQEDILSVDVVYGKSKNVSYMIKNKMIKLRNLIRVGIFNKFEVPFMSVFLTQRCTLRCRHCSDLMPYYLNPIHFPYKEVIFNLKRYLSAVDHVHYLLLCGGETFLYPELEKVLVYCIKEKRIHRIGIVTNGTILPNSKICKLLTNPKVRVRISDYKCVRGKRKETIKYLEKYGIIIENLRGQKWYDVGGFENRDRSDRQLQQIFRECSMNRCFEINRSKVIYCARQRSGELGLTPEIPQNDYVSLMIKDRERLRKNLLKMYDKKFLRTCNYCDGITKRSREVIAGEQ